MPAVRSRRARVVTPRARPPSPYATPPPAPRPTRRPATTAPLAPRRLLDQEAAALLDRLARVKPLALTMPTTAAAAPSAPAQQAIERYLVRERRALRRRVRAFRHGLGRPAGRRATPEAAQRRFALLKLLFNRVLTQFDLFADVVTQRSEHENGVRLAGLDVAALDALRLDARYYDPPPVLCYLDRGHGAAIRRARTRLPGGGLNPVAVIRVPRERMIGSGIAASLLHEVGHQGNALLDLVETVSGDLQRQARRRPAEATVWGYWQRWISEILSDFWALAHLGVGSTLGLMGVVSLPRAFVFRFAGDAPHPPPYLRALLSCAMGEALFPDPQWQRLRRTWRAFYPLDGLRPKPRRQFERVLRTMPAFVRLVLRHRPPKLRGQRLPEAFPVRARQPDRLRAMWRRVGGRPKRMVEMPPSLVFAVLGQAKADGHLPARREGRLLSYLLPLWALRATLRPAPTARTLRPPPARAV
jgi:hypothetical protein